MGQTFQDLLDEFIEVVNRDYRSDPERAQAVAEQAEMTLLRVLEMLRDKLDK